MEEEIQSVTSSEWNLVRRRLDDLENLVTDLKSKFEILGECKCNRSNSYLETQHSEEVGTETGIGFNPGSTSKASGIVDISGQSTTHSDSEEILTLAGQDANNTADLTSTASSGSNLGDSTSANAKYRRAQVKLTRCDQVKVTGTSSTSGFKIANNKPIFTSTCKESQILFKKRPVLRRKENGIMNNKSAVTSTKKKSQISSKKRPVLRRKENGVRADGAPSPSPPSRKERFVCPICSKRFGGKSHLTVHMRVHTGDKPFHCNICSMKFKQRPNLKRHTRVHTEDKPFECGFCSKKFGHGSNLAKHRRVHTGEKPFECGSCSKKFSRRDSLTWHVRRHTGERPYTCQFCSNGFATHSDLTSHLRVHTREKPYSCPVCPKVFVRRRSLIKHLTRHPGVTLPNPGHLN